MKISQVVPAAPVCAEQANSAQAPGTLNALIPTTGTHFALPKLSVWEK